MLLKSLLVWVIIIAAEVVHGIARRVLLEPRLGDLRARQICVFTGSAIILFISILFVPWTGATSPGHLLMIGVLWLVLTLAFEVSLGLMTGSSWERILSDYDPRKGGLLSLGMLILALSPLIAAKLRGII